MKRILTTCMAFILIGSLLLPAATVKAAAIEDPKYFVSETIGTKTRKIPEATDYRNIFGVGDYGYPAFDSNHDNVVKNNYKKINPSATEEQLTAEVAKMRAAVLAENKAILDYDAMDKDGNLYKDGKLKTESAGSKTITKLIRHTAGVANFGGTIPDSEPSTTKKITLRTVNSSGNIALGLYAPPGEVVTIRVKNKPADINLQALIGEYGATNQCKNLSEKSTFVRMPYNGKYLAIDNDVNYVGTPLGGPIYLKASDPGAIIELEVEGAVEMPYYIMDATTRDELVRMLKESPGPYIDVATPRGLRIMGPGSIFPSDRFTSDAAAEAMADRIIEGTEFWDKAINVSYQFGTGNFSDGKNIDNNKMSILFDPFIPSGAALNYGGSFCVCPVGWSDSMFNVADLVSYGSWGCMHEINHSFKWGGCTDEVTEIANNVVNAMTYLLYTNIAAFRTEAGGLDGWNWCTDSFYTMKRITDKRSRDEKADNLEAYMPIMQTFGTDRFLTMVSIFRSNGGWPSAITPNAEFSTNSDIWLYASSKATGYDMTYYMRDVLGFPAYNDTKADTTDYITQKVIDRVSGSGVNVFIPSGLLYQSGFVFNKGTSNEEVVETGRAFRIPFGMEKVLNLNTADNGGYLCVPKGVTAELVSFDQPKYGTVKKSETDAFKLIYTPSDEVLEESFDVTMKLTINTGEYAGRSQNVTYKIRLLQETDGFYTTFYEWNVPEKVSSADAIENALSSNVLNQEPVGQMSSTFAGFETWAAEYDKSFAVSEGRIKIQQTGPIDLYTKGDDYFAVYVSNVKGSFPDQPQASYDHALQNYKIYEEQTTESDKKIAEQTRIRIYVLNDGESEPADKDQYQLIMKKGDSLYVRAYVINIRGLGHCRVGYLTSTLEDGNTVYSVNEFDSDNVKKLYSDDTKQTPAKSDYETEKKYSYADDTYKQTKAWLREEKNTKMEVVQVRELGKTTDLNSYGNSPVSNIVDDDPKTAFHGEVKGASYGAEFIFSMDETSFNAFKYIGHPGDIGRGKFKDYEVYAGNDLDEVLNADINSKCFVASGTASQIANYGSYTLVSLGKDVTAKYLRIVAKNVYPSNGQYYAAMSDIKLIEETVIDGVGKTEDIGDALSKDWTVDKETNTRFGLYETSSGVGTKTFRGTGVILYAAMGPEYGTMLVQLDDEEPVEVSLTSSERKFQQNVFWRSDLDPNKEHTLKFWPKDQSKINVEYVEIKNPKYASEVPVRVQDVTPPVFNESGIYAAADVAGLVYKVSYEWHGDIPENQILPVDNNEYKNEYAAKRAVDTNFASGTVVEGTKGNTKGKYTFSGWTIKEINNTDGQTHSTKTILYTGNWIFTDTSGGGSIGGGGVGGGSVTTKYTLTYNTNGGTSIPSESYEAGKDVTLTKTPARTGYVFTGWYSDSACTDKITKVTMDSNKTVYAGWNKNETTPEAFNSTDHFAYIVGYEDGMVHPNANITRAQTATVLYRLLTAAKRDAVFTSSNSFSDVSRDLWYNKAVSSMANGGYIKGYSDGTFGGDKNITRAEFVTMLVRFLGADNTATCSFNDVSRNHWAYSYIATATKAGWIAGYSDGSFKPDQNITRAEALTILNRLLNRGVDKNSNITGHKTWADNKAGSWYYYEVIEATNDHEYTGARPSENWTKLTVDYQYDINHYEKP